MGARQPKKRRSGSNTRTLNKVRALPSTSPRGYREGQWRYSFEYRLEEQERMVVFQHAGKTHQLIKNPSQYPGVLAGQTLENNLIQLTRIETGWRVESEEAELEFNERGEILSRRTLLNRPSFFNGKKALSRASKATMGPSFTSNTTV